MICVDRQFERAQETVAVMEAEGGTAFALEADVAKRDECEHVVATGVECHGQLDVLQNNIGIVFATQAVLPQFEPHGGGAIINLSSIGAMRAYGRLTAYRTTKDGVIGLTISLAPQLADKRIRVNAIAPGRVWTPMVAAVMSPSLGCRLGRGPSCRR